MSCVADASTAVLYRRYVSLWAPVPAQEATIDVTDTTPGQSPLALMGLASLAMGSPLRYCLSSFVSVKMTIIPVPTPNTL